jgi:hypothetical protein
MAKKLDSNLNELSMVILPPVVSSPANTDENEIWFGFETLFIIPLDAATSDAVMASFQEAFRQ